MTPDELIDQMDVESLRAFARHVSHLNDRLLSEAPTARFRFLPKETR